MLAPDGGSHLAAFASWPPAEELHRQPTRYLYGTQSIQPAEDLFHRELRFFP
jgi:hypothetical protein